MRVGSRSRSTHWACSLNCGDKVVSLQRFPYFSHKETTRNGGLYTCVFAKDAIKQAQIVCKSALKFDALKRRKGLTSERNFADRFGISVVWFLMR